MRLVPCAVASGIAAPPRYQRQAGAPLDDALPVMPAKEAAHLLQAAAAALGARMTGRTAVTAAQQWQAVAQSPARLQR